MADANPLWLDHLTVNTAAFNDFLKWLENERQLVNETTPKNWDEELKRQGEKIMLDKIKNKCTLGQKIEAQLKHNAGGR